MNKPFILYSSTENKGDLTSYLCMKMFYNRVILYCGLFRWDRWLSLNNVKYKLQPLVIFSFCTISMCLFKTTLTPFHIYIFKLKCLSTYSAQLHETYRQQGPLNRDRKWLKSGWGKTTICCCLQSPGPVWESSAFWSRTQRPIRVEEEIKGGLRGQPTGSMVNPRPPPLLFFGLGFRSLCS